MIQASFGHQQGEVTVLTIIFFIGMNRSAGPDPLFL